MNRFDDLCLNDRASENTPTVGSRDWQPSASRLVATDGAIAYCIPLIG